MGWARSDLVRGALLVLLTLATFLPALGAGFIWDDDGYLTHNPLIKADDGLRRIWLTAEAKDYYPLVYTSFWLQWRLWGENPLPYHALNVLQHAMVALLLWRLLIAARVPGAWFCALLFAVHPLNVESVAWIAQQKNTLALLLFAGSVLALTRFIDTGRRATYWCSFGLFVLSLLAKPLAVFWPLVLPVYVNWHAGSIDRRDVARTLPFVGVSMVLGWITLLFQHAHALAGQQVVSVELGRRLAQASGAWLFYLQKTLLPIDLCAIYPRSVVALDQPVFWLLAAGVTTALGGLAYSGGLRHGLLALLYYTAMLVPVSGLIGVGFMFYSPVADHWAYGAMIAVIASICAAGGVALARASPALRTTGIGAALVVVVLFSYASHTRSRVYRDQETLFTDTVARNPQAWAAHTVLGTIAFYRQDLETAEDRFEQALQLKPGYWEALHGLAVVYASRGEAERAVALFEEVLRQRPDHAYARANLDRARKSAER